MGRTVRKIWPRLDEGSKVSLLKLQRSALNVFDGVIMGHCIKVTHVRRISLGNFANDFYGSCRDTEEIEIVRLFVK